MKKRLKNISLLQVYLLASLLFIIIGFVFLMTLDKVEMHLAINSFHSSFLDSFFKYSTHLGDGLVTALAISPIGVFFFNKYRFSTFVLGGMTLFFTGLLAQFLKRGVFPNAERPAKFIGEDLLYLVPDVDIHHMNSFPSGHTATAFAFFAFVSIAFFRKNRLMQFVMAVTAVIVGYSRMYLSQHFLEDITVGAIVGLTAYFLAHILVSILPFKNSILNSGKHLPEGHPHDL